MTDANEAPTADAGSDQAGASEGATVTLDGSGSSNPDAGDTLTYAWAQTAGPTVMLSGAAATNPTFTAPTGLTADATLEFTLTVTDSGSLAHDDTVTVTVLAGG